MTTVGVLGASGSMVAGATAVPMMLLALSGLPKWTADRAAPVAALPLVVRGEQRARVHAAGRPSAPERPAAVPVTGPVALPARTSGPPARGPIGARRTGSRTVSRHHAAARHAPRPHAPAAPAPAPTPAVTAPPAPLPAPVPAPVPVPDPAPAEAPLVEAPSRKQAKELKLEDDTPSPESALAKQRPDAKQAPGKHKGPHGPSVQSLSLALNEEQPASGEPVVEAPASVPGPPADQGAAPESKGPKGKGPKGDRPAAPGSRPPRKGNQGPGRKKG